MRVRILFAIAISLAACAAFAGQRAPQQNLQQFVVLRSETMSVPFDPLTSDEAHCAISGNGNFATMRCEAPAGTAKANYHYVTALVVDQQGMAYGIACHQSLFDETWCKKFAPGIAIEGSFDSGQKSLSIADGQKFHQYQTLTSAFVGAAPAGQPVPAAKPAKARTGAAAPVAAAPAAPATPAAPSAAAAPPSQSGAPTATSERKAEGIASAASGACVATEASCVTFTSAPQGADIYVDGKFMGNTPSTLALPAGSHEVRVEGARFKPWTRTLSSTAGSTVTIHATLEKK
jgi:hypothetical protein